MKKDLKSKGCNLSKLFASQYLELWKSYSRRLKKLDSDLYSKVLSILRDKSSYKDKAEDLSLEGLKKLLELLDTSAIGDRKRLYYLRHQLELEYRLYPLSNLLEEVLVILLELCYVVENYENWFKKEVIKD